MNSPEDSANAAPKTAKPRVVVLQDGARHNYAVPAVLERAGMLERVYIDLCGDRGIGRLLGAIASWPLPAPLKAAATRMSKRRLPPAVVPYVTSFGWQGLKREWRRRQAHTAEERHLATRESSIERGDAMARKGLGNATHLFTTLGDGGRLRDLARAEGVTVASDIIIALSTEAVMEQEIRAFPDWSDHEPFSGSTQADTQGVPRDRLLATTDIFLCPSRYVQRDLIENFGVDPKATRIVPYAITNRWLDLVPNPVPGRVLFVGSANLRKGIHYLARAATLLRERGLECELRVAGDVSERVRRHPEAKDLTFLGRIPRDEVAEEFRSADVFCLPSLAEGSATVTYEAMAAGLPVITTGAAGSVVQDGVDGIVIPERSPEAIAGAIETLVGERSKRDAMSQAARLNIQQYGWDQYGERLIAALKE